MKRREFLGGALALAAGPAGTGCTARRPAAGPNVVFLLADQLRASAVGCYGNPVIRTPHLDEMARGGLLARNAFANTPKCESFRVSLMTGRWPHLAGRSVDADTWTLGRSFKQGGYATGYLGKWHLSPEPNKSGFVPPEVRPGWDLFAGHESSHNYFEGRYFLNDDPTPVRSGAYEPHVQRDLAFGFMREHRDEPFALFVSFGPPHGPHDPPDEWNVFSPQEVRLHPNVPREHQADARMMISRYYGQIASLDEVVGQLRGELERLGLLESTLVVFTSDHGEMLWSHGMERKQKPFEEAVRVPMILSRPGHLEGEADPGLVSQVDIFPTLLAACGLPLPDDAGGAGGRNFLVEPEPQVVYLQNVFSNQHSWHGAEWRGVRTPRWKYAVSGAEGQPEVLFDLTRDPFEQVNLAAEPDRTRKKRELRATCEDLARQLRDSWFEG